MENMKNLIAQAQEILLERSKEEQELIYYVASLDEESRTAVILAYELSQGDNEA